jgi:putative hydrolase of the HAD superfamily
MEAIQVKYVFFDLDETLSDHKYACQQGIKALMELRPELRSKTVEQLENEFWQMLNSNYDQVLQGKLSAQDTKIQRIIGLFEGCHCEPPGDAEILAEVYTLAYNKAHRAVPGIEEVLVKLKASHYRIAVITNGFKKTQYKKLESCNLIPYIDLIVASEEIGATKPDPRIYQAALNKWNIHPHEAVMIGDSWENDVLCPHSLGMKTIWFNRRNEVCPDPSITWTIRDPKQILDILNLK